MDKIVLVVEDNSADVLLLEDALRLHDLSVKLIILDDGEKAIEWITQNDSANLPIIPSAVVLDLNLPKRRGAEVLPVMRASRTLGQTPIIIFSSSNSIRDRSLQDQYPRTRYIRKSVDFDEFAAIGGVLKEAIKTDFATQ
jgi:DNA-binding response OmpR family regulator